MSEVQFVVAAHYQLHVYAGRGIEKPSPFEEAWATFAQIYQFCPPHCRYAIAQALPVWGGAAEGPYLAWDLTTDACRVAAQQGLTAPPATWFGESVDGLVMKAMAADD